MNRPAKLFSVGFVLALLPASIHVDATIATGGEGGAQDTAQDVALDSLSREPVFTPFDERPELNREKAFKTIVKHYRDVIDIRNVGGGSVHVWVFVDADGRVRNTALLRSSGHKDMDEAAMRAALEFEFTPARFKGEVVPAWITMPISLNITKKPYRPRSPDPRPDLMGCDRRTDAGPGVRRQEIDGKFRPALSWTRSRQPPDGRPVAFPVVCVASCSTTTPAAKP